jgi:anti-sigma B factor antagonist
MEMNLPSLRVAGEIDINRTRELTESLNELVGATDRAAIIDVSGVTFMDSTGLGALVKTNERLRRQSRRLILVCPPGPVLELLDATGLRERFVIQGAPAAVA